MKFLVIIMNYFVLHKILYSTDDSQKTLNDSKLNHSVLDDLALAYFNC